MVLAEILPTWTSSVQVFDYPPLGCLPNIDVDSLAFLHPDIAEACVCVGTVNALYGKANTPHPLHTRWLGRQPLQNAQFWSATKIFPLLNVVAQVQQQFPDQLLETCWVRSPQSNRRSPLTPFSNGGAESTPEAPLLKGGWGDLRRTQAGISFPQAALNIICYQGESRWRSLLHLPTPNSNALSATLKRFSTYAGLEQWVQSITGNQALEFRGNYGRSPFISHPQLIDARTGKILLTAAPLTGKGNNLVSAYDLTRFMATVGWHGWLPKSLRIPYIQGNSLTPIIAALQEDPVRFVDEAWERVKETLHLQQPAALLVLSKDGYGASNERHTDEVTYTAFVVLELPDNLYTLALTLRAVRSHQERPNSQQQILERRVVEAIAQILERLLTKRLL